MATITDYASLSQAIADFAHRQDVQQGLYTDYFIQGAQEKLQDDIFLANFGNGVQWQEAAYGPLTIEGGTAPVPSDWLTPKLMQVSDGAGNIFTLIFKAAAWIYDRYPIRQPAGLPAYIARDVMPTVPFTGTLSSSTLTVNSMVIGAGVFQAGMIVSSAAFGLTGPTAAVTIINQTAGTPGGVGFYTVTNPYAVLGTATPMTAGGSVFVFGPYPDSAYTLQGTYYQEAGLLSANNASNWMVANCPTLLHAACMVEAGKFLVDDALIGRWQSVYESQLMSMVNADKADRWAASTMQIETG